MSAGEGPHGFRLVLGRLPSCASFLPIAERDVTDVLEHPQGFPSFVFAGSSIAETTSAPAPPLPDRTRTSHDMVSRQDMNGRGLLQPWMVLRQRTFPEGSGRHGF